MEQRNLGATAPQVSALGDIVPLVAARRRERLTEALGALDVTLTPEDLKTVEDAVPPDAAAGSRYADAGSPCRTANAEALGHPRYLHVR
jgi:hypothetical protein